MASSELIWQCIKGGNSFMRKGINNTYFSAEAGNLAGKHSYKHSGIANKKSVGLTEEGGNILLTKGKVKKSGRSKTVFKKDARRVMKGVSKEVTGYRSDLSDIATRRVAALAKSVRVAKASK
ncbi:ribosomal protein L28 [Chloropicon primus]|uniref:Ribosomal protein L28 n=1 Tax=Chloropicon primus TaxID=1764295 RepID=A0A5B8MG01_9CHLO|nr:ribosomal protein L28 [Chloropicon primus]UPQ98548.1 ribosomal protein L28 [Chloropicon primus]|mmetsp:Transcript_13518/g.37973  ORF Transcript_13518/g.37973 Transcript_13518/m.37973 type:complete len:122 (-) Transcript_13518:1963-2328(-)|eukprot:QDZ19339.1 ribosomal protein L28 [Chloropicon primus]